MYIFREGGLNISISQSVLDFCPGSPEPDLAARKYFKRFRGYFKAVAC